MTVLIGATVALTVFLLVSALAGLATGPSGRDRACLRRRLEALAQASALSGPVDMVRRRELSQVPWLHRLLSRQSWIGGLEGRIRRAGAPGSPGLYLLGAGLCGVLAFLAAHLWTGSLVPGILAGAGASWMPLAWLGRRERARMAAFQRQLGDALDLMARALKAGQTFAGAMRMVANEYPDPIGPEFAQTLDEINFGLDVDRALANLVERVDCMDLRFFVTALNIQRETGGNLAEIVGNLAHLIRERFKLFGRVRVLASEGRLSAIILIILPFAVAFIINLLNPGYMAALVQEPIGRIMAWGSLGLMGVGAVTIRRMIAIKV